VDRVTAAIIAGMILASLIAVLVFLPVHCVPTNEYKKLMAYDAGGFCEPEQATFDDGTIVFNPVIEGGIQIGATYRKFECYNIFGWFLRVCWRKVNQ